MTQTFKERWRWEQQRRMVYNSVTSVICKNISHAECQKTVFYDHLFRPSLLNNYICMCSQVSQLETLCRISAADATFPLCSREADSLCCTNVDIWHRDNSSVTGTVTVPVGSKSFQHQHRLFSHNYTDECGKKHQNMAWNDLCNLLTREIKMCSDPKII